MSLTAKLWTWIALAILAWALLASLWLSILPFLRALGGMSVVFGLLVVLVVKMSQDANDRRKQ